MDYQLMKICWLDARSDSQWIDPYKLDAKLAEITTVGFLVKETNGVMVMADSIDASTGNVSEVTYIPVQCVTSRTRLKTVEDDPVEAAEPAVKGMCGVCRRHPSFSGGECTSQKESVSFCTSFRPASRAEAAEEAEPTKETCDNEKQPDAT